MPRSLTRTCSAHALAWYVLPSAACPLRAALFCTDAAGDIEAPETDIAGDAMLKALGTIPLAHQPGTVCEYSIAAGLLTLTSYRILENPAGKCYFKGGSGLVGTAEDYLRFAQMVLNGGELDGRRYLSKKMVEFMLSDHTVGMGGTTIATTGPGYGFGLGWGVRLHDGFAWVPGSKGDAMWAGAWGTSFWVDPKEGLVGILMAQGPSTRVHTRMLYKNLVYGAIVR